jgi:16S rRNA processing protein RimM
MAMPTGNERACLICIAEISGAHGLRGEVRLRSFAANPSDIEGYAPLLAEDGARSYEIASLRPAGAKPDLFIARLVGITDRHMAEALAGARLHARHEQLAQGLTEQEFLHADLIGCRVEGENGEEYGKIVAVQNFGAGDLLEIALRDAGRTEFVPFTRAFVPRIDIARRKLVITIDPFASG